MKVHGKYIETRVIDGVEFTVTRIHDQGAGTGRTTRPFLYNLDHRARRQGGQTEGGLRPSSRGMDMPKVVKG